ncbi:hypothetical protein D3C87_1505120 [compost metagenome]
MQRHLFRRGNSQVDPSFQRLRKSTIENFKIDLEIQPQRAGVDIRRTDISPAAVDRHQLRVVERSCRPPDAAIVFQHLVELRGHGEIDQFQVVGARYDDIDHHAAPRRRDQRSNQLPVGQEIR